ncbi:MAG: hypothetical protein WDN67_02790 [Candidatus Moraniibacteriota bacterium]
MPKSNVEKNEISDTAESVSMTKDEVPTLSSLKKREKTVLRKTPPTSNKTKSTVWTMLFVGALLVIALVIHEIRFESFFFSKILIKSLPGRLRRRRVYALASRRGSDPCHCEGCQNPDSRPTLFTGSIDGDQLLVFPESRKAIIWSPTRKIIVNAGPIQDNMAANNASGESSVKILRTL